MSVDLQSHQNRWLARVIGFALVASVAATAGAQRRPRRVEPTPPVAAGPTLEASVAQLGSSDPAVVQQGLEALGLRGSPDVVAPIAARIRRGLPPDLLEVAVDTLVIAGGEGAGPVLISLVTHRRPAIRLKALLGIASLRPRGAEQTLVIALSDSDASIRAAAAVGLGQVGARGSVDPLFLALERGVLEASTAIGQLATPAEVVRFLGYIGRVPFDGISPGLGELLARADIPDRTKLDIVARLAELATSGAKIFLQDYVAALPTTDRGPVRRAAEDAAMRIAD